MCQHPLFTTAGRGMLPVDTHSCPRTVQAPHADLQSVPWSVTHLQGTSVSTATLTKDSIMEILEELATWTSTGARAQSLRRDQFHSLLRAQPSARCPGVHAEGAQPSSGFKQGYGGHRVLMRCPSPWRYLPSSRGGTLPLALCLCSRVASARPGGVGAQSDSSPLFGSSHGGQHLWKWRGSFAGGQGGVRGSQAQPWAGPAEVHAEMNPQPGSLLPSAVWPEVPPEMRQMTDVLRWLSDSGCCPSAWLLVGAVTRLRLGEVTLHHL